MLTIIAFILSGLIGTWLTVRYQREQHEQEVIRKNMDDVRLSIDTTNQAFEDFLDAASVLNDDITIGAENKRLEEDKEIFWKARRDLDSKLAIETPRIRQAMPLGAGGMFQLSTSLIRVGVMTIADCFKSGEVIDIPNAGSNGRKLECKHSDQMFSIKYADERIAKVQLCVTDIYFAIRPSPFNDLNTETIVDSIGRSVKNLGAVCNGVTMLGLPYDKTYGKYINQSNMLYPDN
ncbi:hypothetical protein [Paraburkholderia piptadeniae]|uniref:hypothetical protein n=1 Tax=Paraburkholderia piptadeniae TaxID=1701573 RepID=UPI000B3F6FD4|nr:hypothetical protein [Paraburkholderia piptadeniae]